ncbi:hypothetical protein SH661x_004673 [Planctomicrobium sp. SH661]|uniref:hypothetical protein n=1 Tax=Planctomicrobium sp. SH661 TaxID=3448124 RepID=UPI003F5AFAE7
MSVRLPKADATPARQRNGGTWLAMILVVSVIGGILALISMVMPDIFGLLTVLSAFGGFVTLHYFTWGRWLTRISQPPAESTESRHPEND